MNDLSVIDRFTAVFSQYIDSGFGLLHGEIAHLSAILIGIDVTLAALFWAMGETEDVIVKLVKKILYVGAFAFIISNFNSLSSIIFRSFADLGLIASGSGLGVADFLHPGRLAKAGVDAAAPLLTQMGVLSGFPDVFLNLDTIAVLFLAWLIVILSFFLLAVQLFVTLIEFKLTTLAGFVLVPFALWNKTAFLAERVLGSVVTAGVKVLVLAVIAGIGSAIFAAFPLPAGTVPTIDHALTLILASLALFGLGIFGPAIASGLVTGAPQLGAGAALGTVIGAGGVLVAGGAATVLGARASASGVRAASSLSRGARDAYRESVVASGATGASAVGAGLAGVARAAAQGGKAAAETAATGTAVAETAPTWAQDAARRETLTRGLHASTSTIKSSDHGGSGATPDLSENN